MIKAIETRYKGYRFRSRLEARWAVFFDAMGIRWEYEPEGFDMGEAGWYLPDFYLPDFNAWVEIKGGSASEGEIDKCCALFDGMFGQGAATDVISTYSVPALQEVMKCLKTCGSEHPLEHIREHTHKAGKVYVFSGLAESGWLTIPECVIEVSAKDVFEGFLWLQPVENKRQIGVKMNPKNWNPRSIFPKAVAKARAARFEHGENG